MPLKVIGAGYGRTGTLTLKLALEELGFGPCYHMMEVFKNPEAPAMWEAVADGEPRQWEKLFEGYNSTVDWPSATYALELAQAYPEAKVILSVRDPEAWFRSTQSTIFARDFTPDDPSPWLRMVMKTVGSLFDLQMHDHDRLIAVYEAHNQRVREQIAPERLLEWDAKEGWGPLCAFLGVAAPDHPLPKVNTTEEFQIRVAQTLERAATGHGDEGVGADLDRALKDRETPHP